MSEWIGVEAKELTEESATAILKDWLTIARHVASSHTDLHESAGINRSRLAKLTSIKCKETPTPDELSRLSTATGYPIHDLAARASNFLHQEIERRLLRTDPLGESKITSRFELKAWLKAARTMGRSGKLTQQQLGEYIGKSAMSLSNWENPNLNRIPKFKDIKLMAAACGVPEPVIDFDLRTSEAAIADEELDIGVASTLSEEILHTGRQLSRHAHAPEHVERNAQVFRARYGGHGDEDSTLQAIGDDYGLTRERIRQIVKKQLSFLSAISLNTECFKALATACKDLEPCTLTMAEERLHHLLGGDLSLKGANDYGRDVLGEPLPVQLVQMREGDICLAPGNMSLWFQSAITQSKAIIRHCGAAQFNLAWALTLRQHQDWISQDLFLKAIALVPGFDWIDDDKTWFWFGPEGSANRLIKRSIEILAFADRPLDIEIIYGGMTRYSRTRTSDISEEAGVWPPMDIVQKLLAKSPALVCQQGDDFRLASEVDSSNLKQGVAEAILAELKLIGGLASRSELYQELVVDQGINPVSFSVALAQSPLLRQVDRGVFAIRGWPISAIRLTEAQSRVGTVDGPLINFKEVDVTSNGDVSWVNTLSKSSISNYYAGVPSKALLHLPEGQYSAGDTVLTITDHRMLGLIRLVVSSGGVAGTLYRITANARTHTARVEIIGQAEPDDEDSQ